MVIAEIDSAAHELQHCQAENRDEAIHEARKSLKKIRGALRLVRPALGETYREENEYFRDLGRGLSDIRDAQAIGEVFEALAQGYGETDRKDVFDAVRRGIGSAKREKEESVDVNGLIRSTLDFLSSARQRIPGWLLRDDDFAAAGAGLKLTYRRGRRALGEARRNPNPLTYHAFRKRVKDHWYHVRLLESLWPEAQQARESSLHDLESWLGDDHNLAVLTQQMQEDPDKYGGKRILDSFLPVAGLHQEELRSKALALGQRLYEEKPRDFVRKIQKLWEMWRHDPKSLKQAQKERRNAPRKRPAKAALRASPANKAPAA